MRKQLLIAASTVALMGISTSSMADFVFVNQTGDNILIEPAKYSKYCARHELKPKKGYYISLGDDSENNTSINISGKGNPGRTCTQNFNIYQAPGSNKLLGYLRVRTHDTDAHVDQQVLASKNSNLKASVSKNGTQVIITD